MSKVNVEVLTGFWLAGWMFTWGYLKLVGEQIFYAFFIWAYYLGRALG